MILWSTGVRPFVVNGRSLIRLGPRQYPAAIGRVATQRSGDQTARLTPAPSIPQLFDLHCGERHVHLRLASSPRWCAEPQTITTLAFRQISRRIGS